MKCDLKSCTEQDDGGRSGIGQGECKLERHTYINDIDTDSFPSKYYIKKLGGGGCLTLCWFCSCRGGVPDSTKPADIIVEYSLVFLPL